MAVSEIMLQTAAGDSPLGFRLTGGSHFSMPLTVFEVSEGSAAHRAGVRAGDVLLRINGADAAGLSLRDAHHIIAAAGDNVRLSISNLDDQELTETEELIKASVLSASDDAVPLVLVSETSGSERDPTDEHETELDVEGESEADTADGCPSRDVRYRDDCDLLASNNDISYQESGDRTSGETSRAPPKSSAEEPSIGSSIVDSAVISTEAMADAQEPFEEEQYVDVRSLPLRPPRPAPVPEKAQRRCWHPVMWETSPPPDADSNADEQLSTEDDKKREYPHKQRIRNLRRLMAEGKVKPEAETIIFFLCNKFAVSDERKNKMSL